MKPLLSFTTTALLCLAAPVAVLAQLPLISSPSDGTTGVDADAPLTLAWTTVPNATAYVVELSEEPNMMPLLPLMGAEVPAKASSLGQTYVVRFTNGTTLSAGRTCYYWRVFAIVDGTRIPTAVARFGTAGDPFAALSERNFFLSRAEDGVDKDKPATLSFIRKGGDSPSTELTAEFLFGWEGPSTFIPRDGNLALTPLLIYAGKMSSTADEEDTMSKAAGGLIIDWSFGGTATSSLYQTVDVAYEGTQEFDDANLLLEYLLTYSGPGVGRFLPALPAAPAQVLVRPYFMTAFGKQVDAPDTTADDTQTRVGGQIDVKVRLNALARLLGISGSLLSLTDRWFALSGLERNDANYFTGSVDLQIAKGFTVGYVYKRGADAPEFKGVNRMAITVGIGFGR